MPHRLTFDEFKEMYTDLELGWYVYKYTTLCISNNQCKFYMILNNGVKLRGILIDCSTQELENYIKKVKIQYKTKIIEQ